MTKMNFNVVYIIFSVVIGLCALFSPMLVTRANNKYQLELKKLEINNHEKERTQEIIDGYFRNAGAACGQGTTENISKFGEYSQLIYLYLPSNYHDKITIINTCLLSTFDYETAFDTLENLSKEYSGSKDNEK